MEELNSHSLSFSLDEENGELRVRFDPADGMPAPDMAMIRQALTDKGWSDCHLDDKAVDDFITGCRKATQPLEMAIGARRDGEFALTLDDDLSTAWLTLVPPQGGRAVSRAVLDETLREQGIIYGIDHQAIDAAFAAGQCERAAIARGDPPQEGVATRFNSLFDQEKQAAEEEEEELERIKYADLAHLLLVGPGDKLMRRIPPVPGKNGTNIKGHPILPQPTPDIPFRNALQGTAPDPGDPDLLIATSGGQPTARDNGVMVNPVIEVLNVDLSTGNIEFEGTLRVGGDIKSGMRIKVTGDVIVNGTIEAAEIHAGGNVASRGGIVGHLDSRPGSQSLPDTTARIFCEGSVQALFMENAHVEAGKSILIDRSSRQCELIARDEVVVGKPRAKTGQIIGGRTQATLRVATGVLGASTGIKTHVQVGFDPYLEKQIQHKDLELKRKCDEIDRVIKLLAYFRQNPKKGEGGVAEKVEGTRRQLLAHIDALTAELKTMREKVELSEQARVDVGAEIYYGAEVRIAQQVWQAPDDMSGGSIQMQGSRIAVDR
jgi:uncharacterized protein (DUF342 family)